MTSIARKGWHSRGYLRHFDGDYVVQSVTFGLADSVPQAVLDDWATTLQLADPKTSKSKRRRLLEKYMDKGHGACWLAKPEIARLVQESIMYFDEERYCLHGWVIMPNHVHVLLAPTASTLPDIIHSWKSYTALKANRLLGRQGKFWRADYYDRFIRSEIHYQMCLNYIENNPVNAGLCLRKEDWPFSSASVRRLTRTVPVL